MRHETVSITYSKCVSVASVIQHAMLMCHISSVACPAVQYFIRDLFRCTVFHPWPVPLYSISSVACPAVQYFIRGLSLCTVFHPWPVPLYSISSVACPSVQYFIRGLSRCTVFLTHYLVNGTNFGETFVNIKYLFRFFPTIFVCNISLKEEFTEIW